MDRRYPPDESRREEAGDRAAPRRIPGGSTDAANGRGTTGHAGFGSAPLVPPTNGHAANGHATNGHATNGHATNGHAANGHAANGHATNGHAGDGDRAARSHSPPGIPTELRALPAANLPYGPICRVCPLRPTCRSICDLVEAILPSMERGRVDAEDLPRLHSGIRMRRALLDGLHTLTPHQQEVVRLYYRESLQQAEIAERLGVSQQAIHDTLRRARHAIGERILHGGRGARPGRPLDS